MSVWLVFLLEASLYRRIAHFNTSLLSIEASHICNGVAWLTLYMSCLQERLGSLSLGESSRLTRKSLSGGCEGIRQSSEPECSRQSTTAVAYRTLYAGLGTAFCKASLLTGLRPDAFHFLRVESSLSVSLDRIQSAALEEQWEGDWLEI